MIKFASEINWDNIRHFSPSEWPDGCLDYMGAEVIYTLDDIRKECGHVMTPSPVYAGHVRHNYTESRHSTKLGNRVSDASDIFMRWNTVYDAWLACVANKTVGGLGFYTDTHWGNDSRPMLHIDLRPGKRVFWVRSNGEYFYHHKNPAKFYALLAKS